ncbi:hypothetical protein M3Y98_00322200 [Aphelenchoides besseyi]|nr:hypothetical protein M3Y98_00322200 [Aphelenchoides besseyi]KAI6201420.1 hypothetical protein M3Y96_00839900 [Aphelenchoides besseyi]
MASSLLSADPIVEESKSEKKSKKRAKQKAKELDGLRLQEYKDLKLLYTTGRYKAYIKEIFVTRRITIHFNELNQIEKTIEKDLKRVPLSFDYKNGVVILATGSYYLARDQLISGIQAYQHIEYKVKCIGFTPNGAKAPFQVTAINKKASGLLFGRIPALISNPLPKYVVGEEFVVFIKNRVPTKFGAVTFNCEPAEKGKR